MNNENSYFTADGRCKVCGRKYKINRGAEASVFCYRPVECALVEELSQYYE